MKRQSQAKGETMKQLSIPQRHQLKIALDTLKMSDVGALIMGGPSKAEAVDIIERLTGRRMTGFTSGKVLGQS